MLIKRIKKEKDTKVDVNEKNEGTREIKKKAQNTKRKEIKKEKGRKMDTKGKE